MNINMTKQVLIGNFWWRWLHCRTGCRINEGLVCHRRRDSRSQVLNNLIESWHKPLEIIDYKITGTGYGTNTMEIILSELLVIKGFRRTLNKKISASLKILINIFF